MPTPCSSGTFGSKPGLASAAQWQVELSALSGGTLSQRAAGKLYLRLLLFDKIQLFYRIYE